MIAVTVANGAADYGVLDGAPGTEQLFAEQLALFLLLHCEWFTSSTTCILLRVFKSSATAQEELVRTQRRCLSLSSRRLLLCPLIALAHDESRTHERWGRMANPSTIDRTGEEPEESVSFQFFGDCFHLFFGGGGEGGGGLPFKYVWRLAFNILATSCQFFSRQLPVIFSSRQ